MPLSCFLIQQKECAKQICDEVDLLCEKVYKLLPSVGSKISELQPGFGVAWETITQLNQLDNNSGAKLFRGDFRQTNNRQFDELKTRTWRTIIPGQEGGSTPPPYQRT